MSTEKKLLDIISKITTDKTFQDKVIELYEQESPLKKYAWYNEQPKKENTMVEQKYSYDEFYDLFHTSYKKAIKSTQEVESKHDVDMRRLTNDIFGNTGTICHDYGEGYDDFFTYGQVYYHTHETVCSIKLPYLFTLAESTKAEEYLMEKDIKLDFERGNKIVTNYSDGKKAYRTLDEWESIIFNSPLATSYLEEEDDDLMIEINDKFNPDWIDRKLSDLTCEMSNQIKSLDSLSTHMPALLTMTYDLLETLVK